MYYDVHIELNMSHSPSKDIVFETFGNIDGRFYGFRNYRGEKYINYRVEYEKRTRNPRIINFVIGEFDGLFNAELAITEFEDMVRYLPEVDSYEIWKERAR